MSNFSEYIRNNKNVTGDNEDRKKEKKYSKQDLKDMIDRYSGYGQDQLMKEFVKLTLEKKRRGELKDSEIEKLKNTLFPMLTDEQKNNLNQLLEMVKYVE